MKTQVMRIVYFVTVMLLLISCVSTVPPPSEESALTVTSEPVVNMTAAPTDAPTMEPTSTPVLPTSTPRPTTAPATDTPTPRLSVSGLILDQVTGQPVAGAEVSAGSMTATTDSNGRYTLADLTPGQYVVSVVHQDYDPALSPILFLGPGRLMPNLELYPIDETPYPEDPMLTNPIDPNGAPTKEDAERLAREQGLSEEVIDIRETKLSGEYLVNYKIADEVRAAVAEIDHDVWELTDDQGQKWWIIKVCGNLASPLSEQTPIPTPVPKSLLPMAEVLIDGLVVRECASEDCREVGTVPRRERVEVFGCLADMGWCEVSWSDGRGWCTGQLLRHLAVVSVVPVVEEVLPTATPGVVAGEGKIVFASWGQGGNQNGIYVITPDGRDLTRLTISSSPGSFDSSPAWSPDKQRIVFYRNAKIYIMNADGSGLTQLTDNPDTFDDYPTWSPDGQQIAFESNFQGGTSINVVNADGTGLTRLTDFGSSPSWSPNGTQIVFARAHEGIHVMNVDGSNLTRLTDGGHSPDWSPDGTRIAFVLDGGIYVMNADGSSQTRLTDSGFQSPAWSPDGQQLVCSSSRDGAEALYILKADGSGLTHLIEGFEPDW